ncbi:MAG TPA: (2Fe-2S)-binding protein [Candidatus Acidoferrum sp.]|nr:(2Fe-2S)-binding protein [Candidatus Acidoferrum sp.]
MADGRRTIRFTLNGAAVAADVAPYENVVEVLQNEFDLYGARESCGQGLCGCCTVIVDGSAISGCLALASSLDGTRVETIEGLSDGKNLDPVQRCFVENSGFQCGFCTPGFILMTKQLLAENADPTPEEIREYLSGNLCRCAAYPDILRSVQAAAKAQAGGDRVKAVS